MNARTLQSHHHPGRPLPGHLLALAILCVGLMAAMPAFAFTVNVVDNNGVAVSGFRWLLQEDTTFPVNPSQPATNADELLSLSFHKSHHPIAADGAGGGLTGNVDGASAGIAAPEGRYYLSVLPYSGHSIGGAPVEVGTGGVAPDVTVTVQQHPLPTATISIFLFEDTWPINGAPDLPEEMNPGADGNLVDWSRFNVLLEEPAGRYGIAGGQVIQDAFGNPLGTTYQADCDPNVAECVTRLGDGTLHPNPDGTLVVRNLAPGKYGVVVIPPTGSNWQQTSTIEGTKVIDAWVKANEPPFFVEFGPPGPHVFVGFIKATAHGGFPSLPGGATATGTVTDMHMSRPPSFTFHSGRPFPGCWVGVNENVGGLPGRGVWAGPCDGDSNFTISGLAPGSYQLKVFDANLDVVIATQGFSVDGDMVNCNGGTTPNCAFGEVPVFNWFTRLNTGIFSDDNQNGFWDAGERGIGPESQDVTLRWRDGTIYQNFPTDGEGMAPFDEVFPFFHWLVAEVSFANKKATGATFVVDAGGPVDTGADAFPGYGELNPLPQSENGNQPYLTEVGPVLTAATQGFLGQTSVMHFGKTDYLSFDFSTSPPTYVGENGGISGLVYYATTRAENDPRFAVAEEWEPGIPRVQLALYADGDIDSYPVGDFPGIGDVDWNGNGTRDLDDDLIDDIDGDGLITLADVDNHPLGNFPGPEDVDHNGNGLFDLGDALQVTWTDSWDDNTPTGCQGANNLPGVANDRCFDGLRNFNQIRPGVFDGGYAFTDYDLDHLRLVQSKAADAIQYFYDHIQGTAEKAGAVPPEVAATLQLGLIPGDYIVAAATPPGYEPLKEEDKNVDFGDQYTPAPGALPPVCVGDEHTVPPYFSISTKDGSGSERELIAGISPTDAAAPFAGETRPLCDRKKVPLSAAQNAAAEFFMTTDVPLAANVSGVILNDLGNEFNPNSPAFGEKFAPPNVPVSFYDFNGKLVNRVYADTFGRFNALLPSTFTANLPQPSGMSPNMLMACMNDAGNGPQPDPYWDPQYSQFCYTFQYMPGTITYLDTPVVPVGAFTGDGSFPVDCERPDSTPMIASVTRAAGDGPYALPGETVVVESMGLMQVDNPAWDGTRASARKVTRDYGFAACSIALQSETGARTPLENVNCGAAQASGGIPAGLPAGAYQVVVINGNGSESPMGVTLTVGNGRENVRRVPQNYATIQAAIDAANAGDLVLVAPGYYDELVVMWKPVKLQGWGAGAVTLNARQVPTEKVAAWRSKVAGLVASGAIDELPGQIGGLPGFPALDEVVFPTEEGAGIFVAGKRSGSNAFGRQQNRGARIDGFTVVGASSGGGIVVNGYAEYLRIGNNRIIGNAGAFGGGIRIGHPQLSHDEGNTLVYDDAENGNIRIHHNHIAKNGGFGGAGGGISLHTGADDYAVQHNWICGNFTQGDGAGIGHLGLSDRGLIEDNMILFNESFAQAGARSGGGIFIGGQTPLRLGGLTPGAGNVTLDANLIRGNLAGAGDGGGLRLAAINGQEVADNLKKRDAWYRVEVFNNQISNNVAGLAGGGISLQDALRVSIRNNTVANNDTTATTAEAFAPGSVNMTTPQPAGIVARTHTADLASVLAGVKLEKGEATDWLRFSDPELRNNIVWHNRSFYWLNYDDPATALIETGLFPASCSIGCDPATEAVGDYTHDLAVLEGLMESATLLLNPQQSLLTDTTGYDASNVSADPQFRSAYLNGARDNLNIVEFTTLATAGAFDEGGNFIQVSFGPLSLSDPAAAGRGTDAAFDYHLGSDSPAIDAGGAAILSGRLGRDMDNHVRWQGVGIDIGADEVR